MPTPSQNKFPSVGGVGAVRGGQRVREYVSLLSCYCRHHGATMNTIKKIANWRFFNLLHSQPIFYDPLHDDDSKHRDMYVLLP